MAWRVNMCFWTLVAIVAVAVLTCVAVATRESELALIEKRVQEYEKSRFEFECGDWVHSYVNHHKTLLTRGGPFLVAVPHRSGLNDRIVGLTSVFMMALLTDRAFQISKLAGLPDIDLAFQMKNIDWTRPLDPDWLLGPLDVYAKEKQYNATVLAEGKYFAVNTIFNREALRTLIKGGDLREKLGGKSVTTFISTNRGRTIGLFNQPMYAQQLHRMGMSRQTAFPCIINFLLSPKPDIFLSMQSMFYKMISREPVLKIAIQIRLGDQNMSPTGGRAGEAAAASASAFNLSAVVAFFGCAEQIERWALAAGGYSGAVWYVASDSAALRAAAVQHYGAKVLTSLATPIEHSAKEDAKLFNASSTVSVTGFQLAAAEWYMQSLAHYHVVTLDSGFGRGAAMVSGRRNSVYTVKNSRTPQRCGKEDFTSLQSMSKLWSGI